jgi:FtsP/CotA-like multicopper oxidase with cupredoxin domain
VDNVATAPTERLSGPGNGLHRNGRRVLTYADLRARHRGADPRPPDREIELHLTGNMKRFIWGFNGEKFSDAEPMRLELGERVRFILVNDTMMEHPIHLHGLWSELENGNGELRPYKHTIGVKPPERVHPKETPATLGYIRRRRICSRISMRCNEFATRASIRVSHQGTINAPI